MLFLYFLAVVGASILFEKSDEALVLYEGDSPSTVHVDPSDYPGVLRAANDLVNDFALVTDDDSALLMVNDSTTELGSCGSSTRIVIGTVGNSSLLEEFEGEVDISDLEGKWESYIIQSVDECTLVVAGSDKRGTIYGIYAISERIGVSPLHYWGDVPVVQHDSIYFNTSAPLIGKEPSVKYRGIFINDEEPSLTNWINENFREGEYTHFVHEFYEKVFELLLRLKANLLWPAMWRAMFALDDDQSQYIADLYGIVMSTSHTEPLQRASNEWLYEGDGDWDYTTNKENITKFWKEGVERGKDYEGVWVEGMRGFGDSAMSGDVESELLEEIIASQRELLQDAFGNDTNISSIPQVWCLYKEVQSYYQKGMEVPDDIILLWVDDNWGNIRRLPTSNETSRPGGAGVYYHFDYVGDPRNYKWINTVSLARTWEQMHAAYEKQARQFWVVNVGDLKGLEIPISYFMDLGYDFDTWGQPNKVLDWTKQWTEKQFGEYIDEDDIDEIADIIDVYGFMAGRRKFEFVNGTFLSLVNYNEAKNVLQDWSDLATRAWKVYNETLEEEAKPAFFEMVLHPINAGYIVYDMHITAGKNELYTSQLRNQATYTAEYVKKRFEDDYKWKKTWDSNLDGKWKHMMDQPHLSYSYWQNPMRDFMPPVSEVLLYTEAMSGSAGLGVDQSWGVVPGDDLHNGATYDNNTVIFPELSPYSEDTWIEVFSRGDEDFEFEVTPWNDYVKVSPSSGKISSSNESIWNSVFLNVSIDWDQVKEGEHLEFLNFTTNTTAHSYGRIPTVLNLPLNRTQLPKSLTDFKGFIEAQSFISIEAGHFTGNISDDDTYLLEIDRLGRTRSGVTLFPVTSDSLEADDETTHLEYDFYVFTGSNASNISLVLSPSLNVDPSRPLRYAVAIDEDEPKEIQVYKDNTDPTAYPDGWLLAVEQNAWIRNTTHGISPGQHTLKVWLLEPNVVLQKILIDFGGAKESFLGPPESYFYNK